MNRQLENTWSKLKSCNDTDCTHRMNKKGFIALKSGYWEEYKNTFRKEVEVTEFFFFDRMKEAFEQVAKDEARKLSTVQEIMIISRDYLRRIVAPAEGQGGVTMSYFCPHWNSVKKHTNWWCAICGEEVWHQTGSWVVQTRESVKQTKVFKAHAGTSGLLREI